MTSLRPRDAWLIAFLFFTFFSFPQLFGDGYVDLGWVLSWFGPGCLLLGVHGLSPRAAAGRALFGGSLAYAAILYWFYVVTVIYGHAPAIAGIGASLGAGLGMATFLAAFVAGQRWLCERGRGSAFSAALSWTVLEHLRSVFPLGGFPWATLGYAQHENGPLLGLATLTGVYGLSFVTVLGSAALADGVEARWGRLERVDPLPRSVWAALAATVAAIGVGQLQRPDFDASAPTLRVAALQGNVEQGVKWNPDWAGEILSRYEALSRRAARQGAKLIVWPETAVPGAIEFDPSLERRLSRLALETGSTLVVGGVGVAPMPEQPDAYLYFDSAFAIPASGAGIQRYDKTHLVPFGEYVPLRSLLGGVLDAIASGIAPSDVTPGDSPRALALSMGEGDDSGPGVVRVGVPICYELLFPDLVRRFAGDGAQLLLAITNDAWYGRTGAPHQFLAMTAMRSAETGLWTVRAANTGVSAIIDAGGRVREQTQIFETDLLVAKVPLRAPGAAATFYVRHGDVFAFSCWLGLLALVATARGGRKHREVTDR